MIMAMSGSIQPKDMNLMIDIHYKKFKFYFSDLGAEDAYQFYKNGECDSCILDEYYALKNYPKDQYNWIEIKDDVT